MEEIQVQKAIFSNAFSSKNFFHNFLFQRLVNFVLILLLFVFYTSYVKTLFGFLEIFDFINKIHNSSGKIKGLEITVNYIKIEMTINKILILGLKGRI